MILDWEFCVLDIDKWAEEFLGSQEAKDELDSGGDWYRLSCRTVRNFLARKLAEKIKDYDIPDQTLETRIPYYAD